MVHALLAVVVLLLPCTLATLGRAAGEGDDCEEFVDDVSLLQQAVGVERGRAPVASASKDEPSSAEFPIYEPEAVQFVTHLTALPGYAGQFYPQARVALAGRGMGSAAEQVFDWELEDVDPMCSKGPDPAVSASCGLLIYDTSVCSQVVDAAPLVDVGTYMPQRASHNAWIASIKERVVRTGLQNADLLGKAFTVHNRQGVGMACGSIGPSGLKMSGVVAYPGYNGPYQNVKASVLYNAARGANYAAKQTMRFKLTNVDPRCSKGGAPDIANSCGLAVLSGRSCLAELGHPFWNVSYYEDSPWTGVSYKTIKGKLGVGTVQQTADVLTGLDLHELMGHSVVVHDFDGQGIACGLLGPENTVSNAFVPPASYTGTSTVSGWIKARMSFDAPASALGLSWVLQGADERCIDANARKNDSPGACAIQIYSGKACDGDVGQALLGNESPLYQVDGGVAQAIERQAGQSLAVADVVGHAVLITDASGEPMACGILNIADRLLSVNWKF